MVVWDAADVQASASSGGGKPLAVLVAHGDGAGKEVTNKQVVTAVVHDGASTLLTAG